MLEREAGHSRELAQDLVDRGFERLGEADVGDASAGSADEVVMVTQEILRQLDVRVLVGGHDPMHDTRLDQLGDVAVGRADGQGGIGSDDRRELHRGVRAGEDIDDPSPGGGVAEPRCGQSGRRHRVNLLDLHRITLPVASENH